MVESNSVILKMLLNAGAVRVVSTDKSSKLYPPVLQFSLQ